MTATKIIDLLTVRELRDKHFPDASLHQVKYALDEYQIEPARRVGITRVYSAEQLPAIRAALGRIADRRTHGW